MNAGVFGHSPSPGTGYRLLALSRDERKWLLSALGCLLAVALLASGRGGRLIEALLAVGILASLWFHVRIFFRGALAILIGAVVLIPIYWAIAPGHGGLPVALTPAVALGPILLPSALRLRTKQGRVSSIDFCVGAIVIWTIVTDYSNFQRPTQLALGTVLNVALLYVTVRIIATRRAFRLQITSVIVYTAATVSVFALVERLSGINYFTKIIKPGYQADIWVKPYTRFGEIRATGSFGQPLVLGTFLGCAIILAIAKLSVRQTRRARVATVVSIVLIGGGWWASNSRTPLLMLGVGYLLFLAGATNVRRIRQVLLISLIAVFAVVFTPVGQQVTQQVANSFASTTTDSSTASSTSYRSSLVEDLFNPSNGSIGGVERGDPTDLTDGAVQGSVDNEYLLTLLQQGYVGVFLLVLLGLAILREAIRTHDALDRGIAVAAFVNFVGIAFVALLLNDADIFWISVALAGGVSAGRATLREAAAISGNELSPTKLHKYAGRPRVTA